MSSYFTTPFPFRQLIDKKGSLNKVSLEQSIRNHLRSLVLMRVGEFDYDRSEGFEMWDHDKEVFYHEAAPYYIKKRTNKGLLEDGKARKYFQENLLDLIKRNEIRLDVESVRFGFKKVDGNLSVYQRKIVIEVHGRIKSTGESLTPHFEMSILYTPFKVETN